MDENHAVPTQLPPVAREILLYLVSHPEAQDTQEGICEWWVLERCIRHRVVEVNTALQQLVRAGLVVVKDLRSAGELFRVNGERLQEIRELLEGER